MESGKIEMLGWPQMKNPKRLYKERFSWQISRKAQVVKLLGVMRSS